jgi:hypothetical protein
MLCLCLGQAGLSFQHDIGAAALPLFRLTAIASAAQKPVMDIDVALFSASMQRYLADKQRRFDDFFSLPAKKTALDAHICGYDPMNMIKIGNDILCQHFIMLQDRAGGEPLFIAGPVVVHLKDGSIDEVAAYSQRLAE